ncbi:MAG: DUF4870 domain-containing protein [Methanomicrobiales archaeon]|nr:DUF4870 domain-containing protein [Methanomicrobiales archaeon]
MTKATFNLDENVASAACYVLGWLTGIIFFLMEKENKTVRFHAMQSIITFLSLSILSYIFGWISGLLSLLISLLTLILWLVLMIKAYQGEKFKLPIVGDIAEGQA